jgi:DNA-binding transcriptional regulator YhcF (GntR family)
LNFDDNRPIFLQIAEGIEDGILTDVFKEGEQIPSITEISVTYQINPATALKGINLLVEEEIIFKKRGVGMFVKSGAVLKLEEKRRNEFFENYVKKMIEEAGKLKISKQEIVAMIGRGFLDNEN